MSSIYAMAAHLPAGSVSAAANRVERSLQGVSQENASTTKTARSKEIDSAALRPGEPNALRAGRDEYSPGEPPQPIGRYWPEKDAEGRRIVRVDQAPAAAGPAQDEGTGLEEEAAAPAKEAPRPAEEERCTVSTDKVDREIEQLKAQKARLEQQLRQGPPPQKEEQLDQKLKHVEEELRQKDNDAYRRRHAECSFS